MADNDENTVRPLKRRRVLGTTTITSAKPLPTRSLKWSDEGRLAVVTAHNVSILTPCFNLHPGFQAIHQLTTYPPGRKAGAISYMQAVIQVDTSQGVVPRAEALKFETNDAELALPSTERPPVREAEWSPTGITAGYGSYLSVLTSTLQLVLFEAKPNGWTGDWSQTYKLTSLSTEPESSRFAYLDSHFVAHRWTQSDPSQKRPTSYLLASTRAGSLLAWRFESGQRGPGTPTRLNVSPTFQGHMAHVLDCGPWLAMDERSEASQSTRAIKYAALVAIWAPALAQVAIIRLTTSSTSDGIDSGPIDAPLTAQHSVMLSRFVSGHQLALAHPGQIVVLDCKSESPPSVRTYLLNELETSADDDVRSELNPLAIAIDLSLIGTDRLRATLANGAIFHLDLSKPAAEPVTVRPTLDVLTLQLEGQATDDLQERISIRRPINGLATCSRFEDDASLPELFFVAQETSELASMTRRQLDKRIETVALMLTAPFDSGTIGMEQEQCIERLLNQVLNGVSRKSDQVISAGSVFSPLLAFYLSCTADQQSKVLSAIWRCLGPLTTEDWTTSASTYHLGLVVWLLSWMRRVGVAKESREINTARRRMDLLLETRHLHHDVSRALEDFRTAQASIGPDTDDHRFYLRLAAACFLVAKRDSVPSLASAHEEVLQALFSDQPIASHATLAAWELEVSEEEGIDLGEHCPACDASVRLRRTGTRFSWTRCAQGHIWRRCGISLELLTEQTLRTCVGCGQETAAPAPAAAPAGTALASATATSITSDAQGGLQRALQAATRCRDCSALWAVT